MGKNKNVIRSNPIILAEQINNSVEIIRCGIFHHPEYGKFEITKKLLDEMVSNFNDKTRGIDIAIDFSHQSDKEAAAWIKRLEIRNDSELWGEVIWTDLGKASVEGKEYRYLSADFMTNYQDNETLEEHGAVLMGAGLTNRPVVKNMTPIIQLSEIKEQKIMDEKDKKIEELNAIIADLKKQLEDNSAVIAGLKAKNPDEMDMACKADLEKKASDAELKCSEIEKQIVELKKENDEFKAAKILSEKEAKFNLLLSEGKLCIAQKEAFLSNDTIKLAELAQPINLSAAGSNENLKKDVVVKSASDEILELARKLSDEKKYDMKTSISMIRKENPELVKKLNEEVK